MLFPLLVAGLVAAIVVSGVVLVQALVANRNNNEALQMQAIADLARDCGGVVTPLLVAEHLDISPLDADRLLRAMVDDEDLVMGIDDHEGVLVFEFPRLQSARHQSRIRR